MANLQTYTHNAIVLRKTKLGETDLIISFLVEDGSQVRAVAKGARKPSSSFSARLEPYSVVKVLFARGRSLDIVKEVSLLESNEKLRLDMEHTAAAAPIVELLDKITLEGLENPKIFLLSKAALTSLSTSLPSRAPAICAAHLLKVFAFLGIRPLLTECLSCGCTLEANREGLIAFSFENGGALCSDCSVHEDTLLVAWSTLSWSYFLLTSRFSEIEELEVDQSTIFSVLRFCQQWTREHLGVNLKSLSFLFTCGLLFEENYV